MHLNKCTEKELNIDGQHLSVPQQSYSLNTSKGFKYEN